MLQYTRIHLWLSTNGIRDMVKGVTKMPNKKIPKAKCKKCKHCKLIQKYGDIRCEYLSKNYSLWEKPKYCSNFEKIGGK